VFILMDGGWLDLGEDVRSSGSGSVGSGEEFDALDPYKGLRLNAFGQVDPVDDSLLFFSDVRDAKEFMNFDRSWGKNLMILSGACYGALRVDKRKCPMGCFLYRRDRDSGAHGDMASCDALLNGK
jgi:hypothetical protein